MNNLFIRRNINTIIKTITPEINNFTLYNSQYIDRIDITVYNPKTVSKDSLFRKNIYNATVFFSKNDMSLYKRFETDDFSMITTEINNFIKNEIKI